MAQFKKYGIPTLVVIAALVINLFISILLHGFVMAVIEDPFSIDGLTEVFEDQANSVILDTFEDGDSAMTLLKKEDGNVFLLEFHKNLLLHRYQLLDVIHVQPENEEFQTAMNTVLRSYPLVVKDHQQIIQDGTVSHSLQFGNFFLLYGLNAVLLMIIEFMIYKTGKNIRKTKKK